MANKYKIPIWYTFLLLKIGKYKYSKNLWLQLIYPKMLLPKFSTILNDVLILLENKANPKAIINIYIASHIKRRPIKVSRPNIKFYIQRFEPLFDFLDKNYPNYKQRKPLLTTYLIIRQILDDYKDITQDKLLNIHTLPNSNPNELTYTINRINKFLLHIHQTSEYPKHLINLTHFYFLILKFVHSFHNRHATST